MDKNELINYKVLFSALSAYYASDTRRMGVGARQN